MQKYDYQVFHVKRVKLMAQKIKEYYFYCDKLNMGTRNKIPNEAIPDCYAFSKQAFEGKITANDAAQLIHEKHGIELNSAISYPYCFKVLITGIGSCSSISSYALNHFFERIEKEYDKEQLKKSLNTFMRLIENYEGTNIGSQKLKRAIHEKFSKLL